MIGFNTSSVFAQSQTTGRIAGAVRDQSGAVISGAGVNVVSRATGEERKVATDDAGNYTVPLLAPGVYQVTVTSNGFKKAVFAEVRVAITETTTLNADLAVGAVTEEAISVNASAPLVQADGAQLGRVVDSRAVAELPLATRNFTTHYRIALGNYGASMVADLIVEFAERVHVRS
jgi:carboxypeptidase family protein